MYLFLSRSSGLLIRNICAGFFAHVPVPVLREHRSGGGPVTLWKDCEKRQYAARPSTPCGRSPASARNHIQCRRVPVSLDRLSALGKAIERRFRHNNGPLRKMGDAKG